MGCEGEACPLPRWERPRTALEGHGTQTQHRLAHLPPLLSRHPAHRGPPKITKLPTAHPQRGVVQSGEKTGHSPSDSSGDTLGASGAGSGWSRGGGA